MSPETRVVGVVEDDPLMGESLVQRLALEGIAAKWWRSGREAVEGLAEVPLQAVVCDIRLPDMDGETLFRTAVQKSDAPPFLFITAHADIDQAVRLMRTGAADYVRKPFDMDDFLARLSELMRPSLDDSPPTLGVSRPMREIEQLLRRVARADSTVLITGETGTGKEVAARFLHTVSRRGGGPFIAVNCAAIPADLLESELFGHEKGAFTGAAQRHLGYAERAGEGILFLDEIGELRAELQAKLLRLIEDRAFHRVGGERAIPFGGRLVAATNSDLEARVGQGRFRADLFYRINVLNIRMPPLRDRADDIVWLMARFFAEISQRAGSPWKGISALAEEAAIAHGWPGNVRELRNRMERAMALSLGSWLMPGDLFPELGPEPGTQVERMRSLEEARLDAEKRHIRRALAMTHGEIASAAKALGIGRTTLWEKMRRLGLQSND